MMFGVQKVVSVQVTQCGKRAGLYTHCFVLSISVCKHSMDLIGEVNV